MSKKWPNEIGDKGRSIVCGGFASLHYRNPNSKIRTAYYFCRNLHLRHYASQQGFWPKIWPFFVGKDYIVTLYGSIDIEIYIT